MNDEYDTPLRRTISSTPTSSHTLASISAATDRARTLFWRARRGQRTWRAVRDGNLKYLTRQDGDKIEQHLFDLAADPAEKTDLLADRPADADRLRSLLTKWEQEAKPRR